MSSPPSTFLIRFLSVSVSALFVPACASVNTAASPTPAPAPVPKPPLRAAFDPAESLSPIDLTCIAEEPAPANALDDDCDGRIDGVAAKQMHIAAAASQDFELLLVGEDDVVVCSAQNASSPEEAFVTRHLSCDDLASGSYHLILRTIAEVAPHLALSFSDGTRSKAFGITTPAAEVDLGIIHLQ